MIRDTLRPGQLVILESTTYPGTTDERSLRPRIRCPVKPAVMVNEGSARSNLASTQAYVRHGLLPGLLARARGPGHKDFSTTTIPKVVGGVDETSGDLAQALYDQIVVRLGPRVVGARRRGRQAHREHLPRGQHRARQRAEDGLRPHGHRRLGGARRGRDEAVRVHALQPRARLGRPLHPARPVLPVVEGARVRRRRPRFIELAGDVNVEMPDYVVGKLQLALNERGAP